MRATTLPRTALRPLLLLGFLLGAAGCPGPASPDESRPPAAEKWFRRAEQAFLTADVREARDSVQKALGIVPDDAAVRLLAAKVALASLDYAETLRLLKGAQSSEAAGLRGRAYWYKGDLEAAADELDAMLDDPEVVDDWAKAISKLARRGAGRSPFALSGGLLASVEMAAVNPVGFFVVPLEIDGEAGLALVSTGNAEVVLDSATRPDPSWISLRFARRFEVRDVPALAQDLSGISKQIGAPIRALLGVNLLRHVAPTIDFTGRQFVVRSFTPPPPPSATRIELSYVRGGGMVVQGSLADGGSARAAFLIDTAMAFPLALDQAGWKKAGVDVAKLAPVAGDPDAKLREGLVQLLELGAFDIPKVPAAYGVPIDRVEKLLGTDLDGILGVGLLAHFRLTLADEGRVLWVEDDGMLRGVENARDLAPSPAEPPPAAPAPAPPPDPAPAPKPGSGR